MKALVLNLDPLRFAALHALPAGVSAESAALTEPLAVGLQAVLDNLPGKNERVLVVGGGVIGAMVVKSMHRFPVFFWSQAAAFMRGAAGLAGTPARRYSINSRIMPAFAAESDFG